MIDDPVLVNDWHPVAHVGELEQQNLLSVRLLGEDVVVGWWRGACAFTSQTRTARARATRWSTPTAPTAR